MLENCSSAIAGVAGCCHPQTLNKMMSDRKHLVSTAVEKLIAATKGSWNEARDRTSSFCADFAPLY